MSVVTSEDTDISVLFDLEVSIVARHEPRQREAIETALERGYYDVPRAATIEDVADDLGCATATAAEHLQKGESGVIAALFDG